MGMFDTLEQEELFRALVQALEGIDRTLKTDILDELQMLRKSIYAIKKVLEKRTIIIDRGDEDAKFK